MKMKAYAALEIYIEALIYMTHEVNKVHSPYLCLPPCTATFVSINNWFLNKEF